MKIESIFGPYVGRQGKHEYIHICPNCGGRSLGVNHYSGMYNCWKCGMVKGRLEGFESVLQDFKYNHVKQIEITSWMLETFSLDDDHINYLKNRRIFNPNSYHIKSIPFMISSMLFDKFGKEDLLVSGLLNSDNQICKALEPGRLLLPYFFGNTLVGFKSRQSLAEDGFESQRTRYCYPPGTIAPQFPYIKDTIDSIILVTEGEFKAIRGCAEGFYTWSLPGINVSEVCISRVKRLLSKYPKSKKYLVLDKESGFHSKIEILRANLMLSKEFNIPFVILPGDEKMGLDDFFDLYSDHDLLDVINESEINQKSLRKDLESSFLKLKERNHGEKKRKTSYTR